MADPFTAEWGSLMAGELTRCGETTMAVITFGCTHEHVRQVRACASCAADIQQVADHLTCWACEESSRSHECCEAVKIEWLSEVARG
jgi:predicted amidophosphoribosyltransferase